MKRRGGVTKLLFISCLFYNARIHLAACHCLQLSPEGCDDRSLPGRKDIGQYRHYCYKDGTYVIPWATTQVSRIIREN